MARPEEVEILLANERTWVAVVVRLLDDAEQALEEVSQRVRGPERAVVLADFESEVRRIDELLTELVGPPADAPQSPRPAAQQPEPEPAVGEPALQLTWTPGHIVAWSAGHRAAPEPLDALREQLRRAGAGAIGWEPHPGIKLPTGGRADAVSVPVSAVLGWLVALGNADDDTIAPSAVWIGLVTSLAVRLVGQG
ncbi:MAG: hypothetical protein OEY70_11910, partial [Acidimicrobiia bacterium]|nr:hypothetical protein [Acidimicrobiia bacterium]